VRDVAIIGAGELGGACAHALARRDAARVIRLIDEHGDVAAGKALDIAQSAPIDRFAAHVVGSADLTHAGGAAIVVIADRAAGGEWLGDDGLALMRRIAPLAPAAIFVCAGASQRELVERGVRELRLARARAIGSAPEALAAAIRAMVALELDASPRDVALSIAGVPPAHVVVPWEDAAIGGYAASRVLDEPARRRIAARVPALWPPGPYALAAAAAAVVDRILGRSRGRATCFVAPDAGAGATRRTAALPVTIDGRGIAEIELPALNAHDRVALENAMML